MLVLISRLEKDYENKNERLVLDKFLYTFFNIMFLLIISILNFLLNKVYTIIDANISFTNRAAKLEVMLLISNEGDNSTISHPTILVFAKICLIKKVNSIGFNPQGVGTDTPGAKAGSKQSKSIEIYT